YIIMAAAVAALYDPGWAQDRAWGGLVDLLIRDATSPLPADPLFPFLRQFDPYEGHSWASGHANFWAGNNQESSSESMNYSTALILWGEARRDPDIRDLGIYLHTTERAAIQQYWFDVDAQNFAPGFPYPNVGMAWSGGGSYATWWTAAPEAIHAINYLPFNGGSLYLGLRADNLRKNYAQLIKSNGGRPEGADGTPDSWVDVVWEAQALFDAPAAAAKVDARLDSYPVFPGETRAHAYHWIHSLEALGQVEPSVLGDIATFAVFTKGGVRTYVAFNGGCAALTVHFTDGTAFAVPAHGLVTYRNKAVVSTSVLGDPRCTVTPARCP
ncbi:MAG TPA: glycosyl hydrolase, partial [Myxococcota bacterium]|nr:glycosyl hydrolase [Myxococcota bacterium]